MATEQTPILECRNLGISFKTRGGVIPAVVDFNLKVMPGESVGLVGESGCGKSTVALAIMRHLGRNGFISSGSILFMGRDITSLGLEELQDIRGSKIAMVYQEPMASLNPSMKIKAQLSEVLEAHGTLSKAQIAERVRSMLVRVRLPDPERIMAAYPHQISGGQQQRILIAMALLANPKLLLLDEPTTALDVTVEAGLVELIKDIAAEFDTSLIYISHNLGLIRETCQKLTVMYSGRAVEEGRAEDIFASMRHPYTQGLMRSIPLPWLDRESRPLQPIRGQLPLPGNRPRGCFFAPRCDYFVAGTCDREFAPLPVGGEAGHRVHCIRFDEITFDGGPSRAVVERPVRGSTVIEALDLQKYYGAGSPGRVIRANENINLSASQGETVAVVGESGCGKSTFAKILIGLEAATGGTLRVHGRDISRLPVKKRPEELVKGLQIVFQNPFETLNPSHTIGSQLMRVIRRFGTAKGRRAVEQRMLEFLDAVKLPREFADRKPRQLSGGQKQRIGIARAFASGADIIVADEPVSALDVSVQASVMELLLELQRDRRTTVIFISHDLSVVRYLADRVVVMYLGRVMEQGRVEDVFSPPYHPYTEALLSAIPIASPDVAKERIVLEGELPSPMNPPQGCPFSTRCPRKIGRICDDVVPEPRPFANGHTIACHLPNDVLMSMQPVFRPKATIDA